MHGYNVAFYLIGSVLHMTLNRLPTLVVSSKIYIPSTKKTQMNLALFCFWADWAVRAVLKCSATFLKYPNFVGVPSIFFAKAHETHFLCQRA